jgi:hypothetical protein
VGPALAFERLSRSRPSRDAAVAAPGSVPAAHPPAARAQAPASWATLQRAAQQAHRFADVSVGGVIQRALAEDLMNKRKSVAIAGEHHGEIPVNAEQDAWRPFRVDVFYESDTIPVGNTERTPDPPILRALYLWNFMFDPLQDFWSCVTRGQDVTASRVTMDAQREFAERMRDELNNVGLGLDDDIVLAYGKLGELVKALPASNAALMAVPWANREFLARSKSRIVSEIFGSMQRIHRGSSFEDIGANPEAMMEARSREMLKHVNAASADRDKTIYKVGDQHVDDMQRLKLKPGAGVAVLSRAQYLADYRALEEKGMANARVSSEIGNEQL